MFTVNAGAMMDGSFKDEDSVAGHRTVQDNRSDNSFVGADHDKPLTLRAPSDAGDNDFTMKIGAVPMSELEEGSYHGDK